MKVARNFIATLLIAWPVLAAADGVYVPFSPAGLSGDCTATAAGVLTCATMHPPSDTTSAIQFRKADNSTVIGMFDTTNGRFNIGPNIVPDAPLVVNTNTAGSVAPIAGTMFHLIGADNINPWVAFHAYGSGEPGIITYQAAGTQGSKTATVSGTNLFSFSGNGWNTSAYAAGVAFQMRTAELWSPTAQGTLFRFQTTPNGTTVLTPAFYIQNSGGISVGTTTDPGIGSLQVNANIFAPNLPTTTGALGAAICYTATTGQFQRDTNAGGCLVSSRDMKHNIETLPSMRATIMAMRPVSFDYNDDIGIRGHQVGFIAEEVAQAEARLAGFNQSGKPISVKYMQATAVLTSVTQELIGDIDRLKANNDSLRTANDNLATRLMRLEAASK